MENKKTCPKCKKTKNLNDFYKDSSNPYGYHCHCKDCKKPYTIKWWKKNPHKNREYTLKKYGITEKQYLLMLKKQGDRCALCKRPASQFKRNLDVDHNHITGHIRGILCNFCNHRIMKHFNDDKKLYRKIVRYLTKAIKLDKEWKDEN